MDKLYSALTLGLALAACNQDIDALQDNQLQSSEIEAKAQADNSRYLAVVGRGAFGPVYSKSKEDPLGLSGYDAISYFTGNGTIEKGREEFAVLYNNVEYRFINRSNAKRFALNPHRYAPQYGGHGALAVTNGYLAPGDPLHYHIYKNKLYLNLNQAAHQKWMDDKDDLILQADEEYPKFSPCQRYDDK